MPVCYTRVNIRVKIKMGKLKYFSTFSGIGGFEVAIEKAAQSAGIQVECVGYSEIDKFADSVYKYHFPEIINYGDITKIKPKDLPNFDLLVGGFPCQPFSSAGQRKGFNDTRGTLFFDLARILEGKRPRLFVFENVPGLLNSDGGRTFATILKTLDQLGYGVAWQVLNSNHFGSPQMRKRVILVGVRGQFPDRPALPIEPSSETHFNQNKIVSYSKTRDVVAIKNTINTIISSYKGVGNFNQPGVISDDKKVIRRLTPIECERAQGFPDNWTMRGDGGKMISMTQRYKMCGNAINVPTLEAVFLKIFNNPEYIEQD